MALAVGKKLVEIVEAIDDDEQAGEADKRNEQHLDVELTEIAVNDRHDGGAANSGGERQFADAYDKLPGKRDKTKATGVSVAAGVSDRTGGLGPIGPRRGRPALSAALDLLFPPHCAVRAACEPRCSVRALRLVMLVWPSRDEPTWLKCAMRARPRSAPRQLWQCRGRKLLFEAARTIGPYRRACGKPVLKAKHAAYEPLAIALGQRLAEAIERQPFAEATRSCRAGSDALAEAIVAEDESRRARLPGVGPASLVCRCQRALICRRNPAAPGDANTASAAAKCPRRISGSRWQELAGKTISSSMMS